jgi:cytoskeletal protein RodZ
MEKMTPTDGDSNQPQDGIKKTNPEPVAVNSVLSFGDWLKSLRSEKKISLEEIAAVTKVHINQLKALEGGERSKLPAPAFVRGFLVSYSRHLGIDENEVLRRYKLSYESLTPLADILMPTHQKNAVSQTAPKIRIVTSPHIQNNLGGKSKENREEPFLSTQKIVFAGVALLGLTVLGFLVATGRKSQRANPPNGVVTAPVQTANPETTAQVPSPVPMAEIPAAAAPKPVLPGIPATEISQASGSSLPQAPTARKFQGEIRAIEQTWIGIRSDDESSRGMILRAGSTQPFDADRKADLSLSDAGSVEIKWNGVWYGPPGSRGDVMTLSLPKDVETLKPRQAPPKILPKAAVIPPAQVNSPVTPAEEGVTPTAPAGAQAIPPQGTE